MKKVGEKYCSNRQIEVKRGERMKERKGTQVGTKRNNNDRPNYDKYRQYPFKDY